MYHKNGNVDVELLTDIGYIAQGLRSQELLWTQIQFKDLHKILIRSWHKHDNDDDPAFPNAVALLIARLDELITTETESTQQRTTDEHKQNTIAKVRLLEEKLIEFYNQQQAELKRLEQQEHSLKHRRPIRSSGNTENLLHNNMNNTSNELNTSKNIEPISQTTPATSTTTTTFNNNNDNSNKNRNNSSTLTTTTTGDNDEQQIIVSTKNGTTTSTLQTNQSIINLNQSTDTNTSAPAVNIIKTDNRQNNDGSDTLQWSIKSELIGGDHDESTTKTAAEQQQLTSGWVTTLDASGDVSPANTTPKLSPKPSDRQLSFSLTNDVIFVEQLNSNESIVSLDGGAHQSGANTIESDLTSMSEEDTEKLKKLNCDFSQFSDDDLKMLIKELRKKIEFTERLNWLCLSNRPNGPPQRKTSLPKHSDVKKRFLEECDKTLSDDVKNALRLPSFDSYDWEDWDVINLMQTMFVELKLVDKFNIPIGTLREWLYEVYKHYNEVPFHNFRHCFCVAQMMYTISWHTNLSARLGDLEVLILLVSCICHDLDHPGYNNIYQINARTELALRYNDISPLENHHCSIAFRLFEHPDCNIFKNFSKETYKQIREGIIRCILATDMARHNEILTQFQEISHCFDYNNKSHTNLLCMVLIKVADISNEARPMDVAEPWLDRLLQEFFAQSAAEKSEGLPVTPFMDPEKISRTGSQVRFIGLVLLPLFEALGELLPELTELIIVPVRVALDYYKRLNDAATRNRRSLAETDADSGNNESPMLPRSQSGISNRSRRSIPSQKSTSRQSVDESPLLAAELQDLPEGSESGDSETATEVEVAEKTSKFKVDTESSGNRQKSSQPSSRKGSREKRPSMVGELYTSGNRIRNSYGNIQHIHYGNRQYFGNNRAISLDQYTVACNNRRMSDGLQAVTSDSSVFYNQRQHRSLDHECTSERSNSNASTEHQQQQYPLPPYATKMFDEDCENMNVNNTTTSAPYNIMNNKVQPIPTNSLQQTPSTGSRSFISRLRQLTGRLSFSFDKDSKRNNSMSASVASDDVPEKGQLTNSSPASPVTIRNNNAQSLDLLKNTNTSAGSSGGYTINLNPASPNKNIQQPYQYPPQQQSTRNRAYSLDVVQMPTTTGHNKFNRYSSTSSSNYADSRKSLTFSRHDGLEYIDDSTNSNHHFSSSINDSCLDGNSGDESAHRKGSGYSSNGVAICPADDNAFAVSPGAVIGVNSYGDTAPNKDFI